MQFILLWLGILLQLVRYGSSSSSSQPPNDNKQQFRSNPYDVLQVDSLCTQKEIQQHYRKLCLKLHPDKQRGGIGSDTIDSAASNDDDFAFKEVQHAYSQIGTEEDRQNYDMMRKFSMNASANKHHDTMFTPKERRGMNMFGGPSTIYFTVGDMSFRFSNGNVFRARRAYPNNNLFFGTHANHRSGGMSERRSKPHYIQKVPVPLDILYSGDDAFELNLKTSIFDRYKAAFKGGVLQPVLMQSALAVIMTWLRSQQVNWVLSLFLFVAMVQFHLPPPPVRKAYSYSFNSNSFTTKIGKGWKSGTKIKYKTDEADVTFILQESRHATFTRVGNDLHTTVKVSARRLRKGGTIKVTPLSKYDEPIKLKLQPNGVKDGHTVTIKSRGWPMGCKSGKCGDLQVKIYCKY